MKIRNKILLLLLPPIFIGYLTLTLWAGQLAKTNVYTNSRELISRINTLFKKKKHLDNISLMNVKPTINDELTKLYNNSYFEHFIKLLVKNALKNDYPVSLILIDISERTYLGNIDGNSTLRDLANVIKGSIRDIDLAARCGSKEFAILLPYCLREEVETIAKRIQTSYASHPFPHDLQIPTGCEILNIKISSFPTDGSVAKELLQNAKPSSHNKMPSLFPTI